MAYYYAILAFLATASLVVGTVVLIVTLLELQKTAKKVEALVEHIDDRVEAFRGFADFVRNFSHAAQSGWMRGAEVAFGIISALRERFAQGDAGRTQSGSEASTS